MAVSRSHLPAVIGLAQELEAAGATPILVGGMALIMLGSQRITMDFDLMVPATGPSTDTLVDIMYRRNFELVTKFRTTGEVLRTVDSAAVARLKVRSEQPVTLPFFDWKSTLRVDLMRDFPVPAGELLERTTLLKMDSGSLRIAGREDLIRLKEIASRGRKSSKDSQDLEFLRAITPT